ncbi:MAG: hypothetical protein D6761_00755 [Candidatus Dadabacteria bacterium]|nr:MAG: hypothetical protein D6761_00755 [Candidatus Dadabacteria bacterium]
MARPAIRRIGRNAARLTGDIFAPQVCALTGTAADSALGPETHRLLPALPETRCPRCDGPPGEELECGLCRAAAWRWIAAAARWEDPWQRLIRRWKLGPEPALTPAFADLICELIATEDIDAATCVVPIPPRGRASLLRGGRIVIDLAWSVATRLRLPARLLLWPERPQRPQRGLQRRARLGRDQAFVVRAALPPGTHRVLLIDDVMTTGATMTAATRALVASWPGLDVCGAVLARAWTEGGPGTIAHEKTL